MRASFLEGPTDERLMTHVQDFGFPTMMRYEIYDVVRCEIYNMMPTTHNQQPTTKNAHFFHSSDPCCPLKPTMPLVKIFARNALSKPVPLAAIQSKLCDIWGTKPNTTKLILQRVEDWTDESFQEDVFVDIRAYGKFLLRTAWMFYIGSNLSHNEIQAKKKEHEKWFWME
jgi:hypothetical protein